jgi:hypothetical protein
MITECNRIENEKKKRAQVKEEKEGEKENGN